MLRTLFAVVLVTGATLGASAPAPAIDFIALHRHQGSSRACRDLNHTVGGGFVACSTYWRRMPVTAS